MGYRIWEIFFFSYLDINLSIKATGIKSRIFAMTLCSTIIEKLGCIGICTVSESYVIFPFFVNNGGQLFFFLHVRLLKSL